MTASQVLEWLSSHWSAAWPIVSALLIVALRARSPEAWVALGESSPRWQGVIRLLRAIGLDPVKALAALVQIVTARAPAATPPSPSKVPPGPVDHRGERGAVRVGTLVALSGALLVATLAGAVLAGCPAVREGVMRVTPGVPDPSGCAEGAQRCSGSVPEVCSASHRWWPALPRRADGTQRVCAAGCAVTDAGVAVCVALDGGSR